MQGGNSVCGSVLKIGLCASAKSIHHYHADNGRFADSVFMGAVEKSQHTISLCGANAHFQNGVVEKRIRDLQEQARK
jgi:hypothetical protein